MAHSRDGMERNVLKERDGSERERDRERDREI